MTGHDLQPVPPTPPIPNVIIYKEPSHLINNYLVQELADWLKFQHRYCQTSLLDTIPSYFQQTSISRYISVWQILIIPSKFHLGFVLTQVEAILEQCFLPSLLSIQMVTFLRSRPRRFDEHVRWMKCLEKSTHFMEGRKYTMQHLVQNGDCIWFGSIKIR
jgi:hypothetical protein